VTYIDVGLKLDIEPTIYLDNEVAIKVTLEVSNIVDKITTKTGTVAYQIGTRTATSVLRLKDGENQLLAGLISDEDRRTASKLPFLGEIPILGRLFGSHSDEGIKTEIVLSITPRILRNIQRPEAYLAEFDGGTETSFRGRPESGGSGAQLPVAPVPGPSRPQQAASGRRGRELASRRIGNSRRAGQPLRRRRNPAGPRCSREPRRPRGSAGQSSLHRRFEGARCRRNLLSPAAVAWPAPLPAGIGATALAGSDTTADRRHFRAATGDAGRSAGGQRAIGDRLRSAPAAGRQCQRRRLPQARVARRPPSAIALTPADRC
jgi:hypothetical protein